MKQRPKSLIAEQPADICIPHVPQHILLYTAAGCHEILWDREVPSDPWEHKRGERLPGCSNHVINPLCRQTAAESD